MKIKKLRKKITNFNELQGRGVIRYSPFLSIVPYFSENLPLYLINTPFPENFQNPVPYIRSFSENLIFEHITQIFTIFSPLILEYCGLIRNKTLFSIKKN